MNNFSLICPELGFDFPVSKFQVIDKDDGIILVYFDFDDCPDFYFLSFRDILQSVFYLVNNESNRSLFVTFTSFNSDSYSFYGFLCPCYDDFSELWRSFFNES